MLLLLEVALDFACCNCGHDMGVTLRCEGERLAEVIDVPRSVKVPCPACSENNVLFFTPRGSLIRVAPEQIRVEVPQASCN